MSLPFRLIAGNRAFFSNRSAKEGSRKNKGFKKGFANSITLNGIKVPVLLRAFRDNFIYKSIY